MTTQVDMVAIWEYAFCMMMDRCDFNMQITKRFVHYRIASWLISWNQYMLHSDNAANSSLQYTHYNNNVGTSRNESYVRISTGAENGLIVIQPKNITLPLFSIIIAYYASKEWF